MKIVDKGVLEPSYVAFSTASVFARNELYFTPQAGHFYCNQDYRISRDYLDLYLLMYICNGSLYMQTQNHTVKAARNEILLLDCHYPHEYFCKDSCDFLWFHFNGNNSSKYISLISDKRGLHHAQPYISDLKPNFSAIISAMLNIPVNEHLINSNTAHILGTLAEPANQPWMDSNPLAPAIHHMNHYFDQDLNLDTLCALCSMSKSQFIRSFKKYLDMTPHEYLLYYRLRMSKQLLVTSTDSIERIAEVCGFNSASHFARSFKQNERMTPTEFRNLKF